MRWMRQKIKVLAISGSLRQESSNTALMKATIGLASENKAESRRHHYKR